MTDSSANDLTLRPIGRVGSRLTSAADAPRQGDEGAPDAYLILDSEVQAGLDGIAVGDEIIVLSWLHEADRSILRVHPRGDLSHPSKEFSTLDPLAGRIRSAYIGYASLALTVSGCGSAGSRRSTARRLLTSSRSSAVLRSGRQVLNHQPREESWLSGFVVRALLSSQIPMSRPLSVRSAAMNDSMYDPRANNGSHWRSSPLLGTRE
jgi:hypothetical protein